MKNFMLEDLPFEQKSFIGHSDCTPKKVTRQIIEFLISHDLENIVLSQIKHPLTKFRTKASTLTDISPTQLSKAPLSQHKKHTRKSTRRLERVSS